MKVKEVISVQDIREFLTLSVRLYKNDANFIRPLDDDIEQVFDKKRNTFLEDGKCCRWILIDNKGNIIGRIGAFFTPTSYVDQEQPTGGVGFFDCINDKEAAFILFDTAKNWLKQAGMEAMDGPINLGTRDRWWGLLVDGFHPPCYCSNYNPPYYQEFFESYGFQLYFKQYTYYRNVKADLRSAHYAIAERFKSKPDYSFCNIQPDKLEKYIHDFLSIYNRAWAKHKGVDEMTPEKARDIVYSLKPVLDEKIVWFAYYQNEPIGFFICIPELNQLFVKYVNGKLDLSGKLRLMWNKWTGKCKTMYGIVFGIVPEHQKKGVEIAMIVEASRLFQTGKIPYVDLQMNWIGDFNPKMMHVAEQIGSKIYKTHHTYRYLFDRTKEFKRHPVI